MAGRDVSQSELWAVKNGHMITLYEKECSTLCGEHWLVRSQEVEIQARYSDQLTWLKSLAISGAFLGDHTLLVSADGTTVAWDDEPVLMSAPFSFINDFVHLHYSSYQVVPGRPDAVLLTMQIDLPQHVSLTVNVGHTASLGWRLEVGYLDAYITLPIPAGGVDGHCGNGNGDLSDDNNWWFAEHMSSWRVMPEDSLFENHLLLAAEKAEISAGLPREVTGVDAGCAVGAEEDAMLLCLDVFPHGSSSDWLDACAIDVCAGGESMANRTLLLAMQSEQILLLESQRATGSCHTCTPADSCFQDVKWAIEIGIASGYFANQDLGLTPENSSCFEHVQDALRASSHLAVASHRTGNRSTTMSIPKRVPALAACSANPGCAGLLGECCPASDGMMLACCEQQPPQPKPTSPPAGFWRRISEGSIPVACPSSCH